MKTILFVSSVFLFLAGGGLKPTPAPASAAMPFVVAQTNNSTATSPVTPPTVELLDPGTGPKQELRFRPTANAKQTLTMTLNMDVVNSMAGQPAPTFKIPASVMTMDVLVTQVDANGDIHSEFSYTDADVGTDPSVPPELIDAMRSAIKQLVGLKGSFVTDNRGQVKSGRFALPEGSDPITKQLLEQMSNSLEQFSAPVPAEAIGKGAKWRVSSSLNVGGINLSQSAIYELVDLQNNVATLNVSMEQQAKSQTLTLPGLPTGATFTLKSLTSQGQGQMTMPLNAAGPIRSNMSMRSKSEMNIKEPSSGQEMPVETNISMQMTIESQNPK